MTVHRRLLVLSAAAAFLLPACISINARTEPVTPSEAAAKLAAEAAARATESVRRSDFAIYRPGDTVAIKPPVKPPAKDTATAQKPPADTIAPPVAPPMPGGGVTTAGGPPGPFPLAPVRSTLPEPPLLAILRAHLENRPERAIEAIGALAQPNQDFVLAILPILVRGATADLAGGDPTTLAEMVKQLYAVAARLEPQAALRVEAVLFCEVVHGFGRYTPWPVNKPYRPKDNAQLYLEVRNLVSQPAVGPRGETFLTHARAAVRVYDAKDNLMDLPDPANYLRRVKVAQSEEKKYTRTPLQDFHILYAFPVPAQPGVYKVTVELSDAAGRRVVRTTPIEFLVAGP